VLLHDKLPHVGPGDQLLCAMRPACRISLIHHMITVIVCNEWHKLWGFLIQVSPASCSEAPLIIDLLSVTHIKQQETL